VVLLAGTGLLVRSWAKVQATDPGLDARNVQVARVVLPFNRYAPGDGTLHVRFFQELEDRLEARPGLVDATVATTLPAVSGLDFDQPFRAEDRPGASAVQVSSRLVGSSYFEALGVDVVSGRSFESTAVPEGERLAVVNESAARLLFGSGAAHAVGRVLVEPSETGDNRYRIVGVAEDVLNDGLDRPARPLVYLPWVQSRPFGRMWVAVRGEGDAARTLAEARAALAGIDPELPLVDAASLAELLDRTVAARRFNLALLAVLAGLALAVAAGGAAGLVAFSVSGRRREMGIRIALGARAPSVVGAAVAPTLGAVAAGAAAGLLAASLLAETARGLLFGVDPLDGWSLGLAVVALLASGALAGAVPAWRAFRADPVKALKAG
jgi:putative ABC transport system permease protein